MAEETIRLPQARVQVAVSRFAVRVLDGPDQGARAASEDGRLTVGCGEAVTLRLNDETVSRFHVELESTPEGVAIRDLGSTNGTFLGPARVREVVLRESGQLTLGRTRVQVELGSERATVPLSDAGAFGRLIGTSAAMRAVYTALERAAPTTVPVLITGESGTGKELAARAVHEASARASGPFEIVDCGGLPPTLVESELFGHERGAFTGAAGEREGAFERADGGTIFLDELGELPLEVQPKLLRALGEGEVRRLGGRKPKHVDVRVVAATNRDLRREVNAGRFRADLFYRLAVIQVRMPALRDRLEDLPALARDLLVRIGRERRVDVGGIDLEAGLWQHAWPGNVRELRNYLEQLVVLRVPPPLDGPGGAGEEGALGQGLDDLPLMTAKSELLARFERRYLERLLARTGGNVAEAARLSGVNRATLFRMIRRFDPRNTDEGRSPQDPRRGVTDGTGST